MHRSNCGEKLPEDAQFCPVCGEYLSPQIQNKRYAGRAKRGARKCLERANSIAKFLIPKRLKALFPNSMPVTIIGSCLVVFFIMAAVIGVWKNGKYDLSGSYTTTEYFPISQIVFSKGSGDFGAFYWDDDYIYNYGGEYRKQSTGNYSCRFVNETYSSGNPVLGLDAAGMAEQCELVIKKVDENTLEVQIIPKISDWAWNGKTVCFYK